MVCQFMQGVSRFIGSFKVCKVCQGMKGCQDAQGLSRYVGFVKVCRVCQRMQGLSTYELQVL